MKKENLEDSKHTKKSCCIFYSMVPLVFILFILYISTYLGTMTMGAQTSNNFTVRDVLQFPPQVDLYGNLQSMAQKALQKPNQFLEQSMIETPNQFAKTPKVQGSNPKRPSRILEPKNFELKRGPSLTFMDRGPTVITTKNLPKTTISPSFVSTLVPNQVWPNDITEGAYIAHQDDHTQAQLEADYMEERLAFQDVDFDLNENDVYLDKNQGILNLPNQKLGTNMMLTPDSMNLDSVRPKKSIIGTLQSFDQLVTFKPDQKSDKVGYASSGHAQIVHHDEIPSYEVSGTPLPTYQASASSKFTFQFSILGHFVK